MGESIGEDSRLVQERVHRAIRRQTGAHVHLVTPICGRYGIHNCFNHLQASKKDSLSILNKVLAGRLCLDERSKGAHPPSLHGCYGIRDGLKQLQDINS
jgi:hypothetical protein